MVFATLWAACVRPTDAPTAETGAEGLVFDDAHVLVVPDADGLHWMDRTGAVVWSRGWPELVGGPCEPCGGEGASADADALLVSFTTGGFEGAVARVGAAGAELRVDGFVFPHDVVRDPHDGTLIVAETLADRIRWIPGDGTSDTTVRRIDQGTAGAAELPNGLDLVHQGAATYLLATYRGSATVEADGSVVLWDISSGQAALVWQFPDRGRLATPHGAVLRQSGGRWWLVWAHTGAGSVGLASLEDPADPPRYVADLVPAPRERPFVFLRGVELTADGELFLTDSGVPGGVGADRTGRIVRTTLPQHLEPAGASGAGDGQVHVALPAGEILLDGLANPFEGWLWRPTFR